MKASQAQQQALLTLLSRIYSEIRAIEVQYHIRARTDDFRPRIDYFHDAVRSFTEAPADGFESTGRLSVESLAADASMLRQIKENPLLRHPELAIPLSPETAVVPRDAKLATTAPRIDVSVSGALSEGYGHYALLFVALLAHPAERNFLNRLNEEQQQVDIIHDLIHANLPRDMQAIVNPEALLAQVIDPELRKQLLAAIGHRKKVAVEEWLEALQEKRKAARDQMAALESAHLRYASSQLILFQDAQPLVKKMALQGLNIVGEFVEAAVQEAQRDRGRGF